VSDHIYRHNIIVLSEGAFIYYFRNWKGSFVALADENLIYSPEGAPTREHRIYLGGNSISWQEWRAMGDSHDPHSVLADPLFVDSANHDYRLDPASPAWALGFQPIDADAIGLLPNHPYYEEGV